MAYLKKSTRKKVKRAGRKATAAVSQVRGKLTRKKKRKGAKVAAALAVGAAALGAGLAAARARKRRKARAAGDDA